MQYPTLENVKDFGNNLAQQETGTSGRNTLHDKILGKTDNNDNKDNKSWWSNLKTGAKVGIIGGGIMGLGLLITAVVLIAKKANK